MISYSPRSARVAGFMMRRRSGSKELTSSRERLYILTTHLVARGLAGDPQLSTPDTRSPCNCMENLNRLPLTLTLPLRRLLPIPIRLLLHVHPLPQAFGLSSYQLGVSSRATVLSRAAGRGSRSADCLRHRMTTQTQHDDTPAGQSRHRAKRVDGGTRHTAASQLAAHGTQARAQARLIGAQSMWAEQTPTLSICSPPISCPSTPAEHTRS